METDHRKIREVREVESAIGQNLFIVCAIVTLVTMILMVTNFWTRGSFLPTNIGAFYLIVVFVYSLHKEFIRWLGEKKRKRQGEFFVYTWIILTTTLYVINFFNNDYFDYSKEGYHIDTLADVAYITIEVLGIFIITRIMKIFFLLRK